MSDDFETRRREVLLYDQKIRRVQKIGAILLILFWSVSLVSDVAPIARRMFNGDAPVHHGNVVQAITTRTV